MPGALRPRQGNRVVNHWKKGERGLRLQTLIEESLSARRSSQVQTFTPVPHPSPRGVFNFLAADLAPAQDISGQVLFGNMWTVWRRPAGESLPLRLVFLLK